MTRTSARLENLNLDHPIISFTNFLKPDITK